MYRRRVLATATLLFAGCMEPSSTAGPDYRIRADEQSLPESATVSDVSPVPSPVQDVIDEASQTADEDGASVTVSREEFDTALEPFCECDASAITPTDRSDERTYYVRQDGAVYRIQFRIASEG